MSLKQMNDQRVYQLIGLCQKARKLISGEFAVKQAVLSETVKLVIITEDASANTTKLFNDKCNYRNIPCIKWGDRFELGKMLGKETRVVIGIVDDKLAEKIATMIKSDG